MMTALTNPDDKAAYEYAKQIGIESAKTNKYLKEIPQFTELLDAKSSYVRTRGFILICNQARWSENGELEAVLDKMLQLLFDTKPTVVRQCLGALQEVVLYRPELSDKIKEKVKEIDVTKYKDTMSPLIRKDIEALLNRMD